VNAERIDCVVIGAGQAGGPLASALARAGRRTVLVEREHAGGTCINRGCTPTKTMVASARAAYLARRAEEYGVTASGVAVDLPSVRRRKQEVVESFRAGSERRLAAAGVELIRGEASFTGPRELEVRLAGGGTRRISAELVFINTGGRPARPPVAGLAGVDTLDSTSIMELDRIPDHLVVLGGGYIGLEFAQMYRRFGSRVTVIQHGPQLLGREDRDIADAVTAILREDGIEIRLNTEARQVRALADGAIELTLRSPEGAATVAGTHLLVATGRVPNTAELNLAAAGVETDAHGFVRANERLQTTAPGVYALGDVKGGPAFTHVSYDDFRVIRVNLLEGGSATTRERLVPYVVFIDPQLGRVGMSEEEALASGRRVGVARMPMSYVARAIEVGETRGVIKAIVDLDTDRILGCAVLGIEGGELMSVLQVAMLGGLPYTALRDGIFAHPTLAESLNNLFDAVEPRESLARGGAGMDQDRVRMAGIMEPAAEQAASPA
jgi:pyruvate/2-oxoglutarate dehydrogenase complex dihydrolipoamide dehydrogenase (E3) component